MLILDNTLLSDYLDGKDAARDFLTTYEHEEWAVSSIVLYESYMGQLHGYISGTRGEVTEAISASMAVLYVTEETAREAAELQEALRNRGVLADYPDALIAASAREHGGRFATADQHFWNEDVQTVLDVEEYRPE